MKKYEIAVIPGDGIGKEVVREAIKVIDKEADNSNFKVEFSYFDWGSDYYFKNNKMMPENALDLLSKFKSIFLGAVGHPDIQDHITLNGLLLPIRRNFDQFACLRPSALFEGVVKMTVFGLMFVNLYKHNSGTLELLGLIHFT